MDEYLHANRKLWDHWTTEHEQSPFYDLAGFKAGKDRLRSIELSELGDVSGKAADRPGAGLLVGVDHRVQLFRIKLRGERGRAHQVTEHHGQLPPPGLRPRNVYGLGSRVERLRG